MNGYLTVTEARNRLGMSTERMKRSIAEGTIASIAHPYDKRARLIRIEDVEALEAELRIFSLPKRGPKKSVTG